MNVLFYTHNLQHYKFIKKLNRIIISSENDLKHFNSYYFLDNGEYRTKEPEEKVDYWIKIFFNTFRKLL